MHSIVTLTLNPTIDGSAKAEHVRPIHKIRTWEERYDPGGGGINAARVIKELGGSVSAIYLSGGLTGPILDGLLRKSGIACTRLAIKGDTRMSHTVHEQSTGMEFRFVPSGPQVEASEWEACFETIRSIRCDYLLASGSLPPGVPSDFYATVGDITAKNNIKFVLDSSGEALGAAMRHNVSLFKPSLGELEKLVGERLVSPAAQDDALRTLIDSGSADMIALTLGRDGAVLATADDLFRVGGISVAAKSAVGAGDSFLGAMVFALATGRSPREAFALGVAAGTATALTPGTELCHVADVRAMHLQLQAAGHALQPF